MENIEWIGGALAAAGSLVLGIVGWRAKQARAESRDQVELVQDRAVINMVDELQEANTNLRSQSDEDRKARTAAEQVSMRAVIDLRMAQKDMQRMRRKMNRAGIQDSEIQSFIDTNLGVLDSLE